MDERCGLKDNGGCSKLNRLEQRVEFLEEGQKREADFRKAFYADKEARIERDAHLDEKISGMDEKLDKLVNWQENQQAKPARRWDGLIDKAIWAVVAAVIAFLLARVGL